MNNEPDELSVLDYFAAAALTGLLASDDGETQMSAHAKRAYITAGWMMAERAKRDKNGSKPPEAKE